MDEYNRFEDPKYIKWAKSVKKRDGYICQICEMEGKYLHSHHLSSWDYDKLNRFNPENGICLCSDCHENFHKIYGKGHNTVEQFEEFKKVASILKGIVKTGG